MQEEPTCLSLDNSKYPISPCAACSSDFHGRIIYVLIDSLWGVTMFGCCLLDFKDVTLNHKADYDGGGGDLEAWGPNKFTWTQPPCNYELSSSILLMRKLAPKNNLALNNLCKNYRCVEIDPLTLNNILSIELKSVQVQSESSTNWLLHLTCTVQDILMKICHSLKSNPVFSQHA